MIYGYRRPPYGVRGCISEDGVTWDVKNEFVIREGGVPGAERGRAPGLVADEPVERQVRQRLGSTGATPASTSTSAIRASSQLADGTILASYHEWSEDERPLQYVRCTRFRLAD